jgi:hypothetical protein
MENGSGSDEQVIARLELVVFGPDRENVKVVLRDSQNRLIPTKGPADQFFPREAIKPMWIWKPTQITVLYSQTSGGSKWLRLESLVDGQYSCVCEEWDDAFQTLIQTKDCPSAGECG